MSILDVVVGLNREKLQRHGSLSLHRVSVYGHARLEQTRESLAWSLCHYSAMEARPPLQRLAGRGNWLMEHLKQNRKNLRRNSFR